METGPIKITCLGTGTSHGVPMIGCDCAVCTSDDPRDRRSRASILIEFDEQVVLVDTGPELRLQCVANNVNRLNAVLYTHHHADHVTGLDDLRRFNWIMGQPLKCYGMPVTLNALRQMFPYVFEDDPDYPSHKPLLELIPIGDAPFELLGRTIVPIPLLHGALPVLGFRVGRFAYCTDCSVIPESSRDKLTDLDVLILDALRPRPHPTHLSLEQAVEMARRIGARKTFFTHIAHAMGHAETNATLPESMALAYDGQVIHVGQ